MGWGFTVTLLSIPQKWQTFNAALLEAGPCIFTLFTDSVANVVYNKKQKNMYEGDVMDELFYCSGLTKAYGVKQALRNVNLSVGRGKIVGLLGPNGSGKTTLLKLANGLLTPTSGELRISGLKPGPETKKLVSYLPDASYLPAGMTVGRMLRMFADFYQDFNQAKAQAMLQQLGIRCEDGVKTLSKGNREKLQLILTMSRETELYLLDEPIGGVDPAARDYILGTVLRNYAGNSTVIISTHLIADVEPILDDAIFLKNGQIVLYQPVADIRAETGKSVDQYFREVFRC